MGSYEESLEHIAEPSDPSDRAEADNIMLPDYVALWFAEQCREWAYHENDTEKKTCAVGIASYIDAKVREEGNSHVRVYAHTGLATEVLSSVAEEGHEQYQIIDDRADKTVRDEVITIRKDE